MPLTQWVPSENRWSDSAHRETKAAYPGQADDRKVALCIWLLASNPNVTHQEIEQQAQDDHSIEAKSDSGKKITTNHVRQARKILGLTTQPKKKSGARKPKSLSKIEKAILARFNESTHLLEEYVKQAAALAQVQEAFDKARAALRAMPKEQADTLAEVDPNAAAILTSEGIFGDGTPNETGDQESQNTFVVWPGDEERS